MDKRQKNNLMTTITLIVVLGQFILWIILLLLDIELTILSRFDYLYSN